MIIGEVIVDRMNKRGNLFDIWNAVGKVIEKEGCL